MDFVEIFYFIVHINQFNFLDFSISIQFRLVSEIAKLFLTLLHTSNSLFECSILSIFPTIIFHSLLFTIYFQYYYLAAI